jgi:hypothetical protein
LQKHVRLTYSKIAVKEYNEERTFTMQKMAFHRFNGTKIDS